MKTCALIVAAGQGSRFGASLAKQYQPLGGRPVLSHSLAAFARHPAVDGIRVVIRPEDRPHYEAAATEFDLLEPVAGGASRQDSVRLGLESLEPLTPARVLIHDAARPFVAPALIDRLLAALEADPGAIPALALADSLKRAAPEPIRADARPVAAPLIAAEVAREGLWRAQTPQAFRYAEILAAHRAGIDSAAAATDDAEIARRAGLAVRLVPGAEETFKITTPEDLARAERLLLARLGDVRVGTGFDVHAFAAADAAKNRPGLYLCGIEIPGERPLAGHSDADVALHALTDALLGALGEADIGRHFPPSDPAFAGAASSRFLRFAVERVAAKGGLIAHLDLTLICEKPKIAPHREAMRRSIAAIAALALDRVSVKATTTEGLGFAGRGEGIAAQAVATVRLP